MAAEAVRWLIKSEEETDELRGKRPTERSVEETTENSVIIIDKHSGPTSHQITFWVKDIFGVNKAGHTGTLDPAVSGVLPVALGNATKAMPVLMNLDKEYVGVMRVHKKVEETTLRKVVKDNFIGTVKQLPPVKSAVARRLRERKIYFFDILEMGEQGQDVLFKVGCEAGTYIRKLCHDIGQVLGIGAHMTDLRRTKVGDFSERQAHSLVEVKDAYEFWRTDGNENLLRKILIPVEYAIFHTKRVFVKDSAIPAICNGAPVYAGGLTRIQPGIIAGEMVAVYSLKEELVALGIARMPSNKMLKAKRGLAVRTDKVFMRKNTYAI